MNNETLIKFSQLPLDVRRKISSREYVSHVEDLEKRYNVKLSMPLLMVIVGDLDKEEIDGYLVENFQISVFDARKIKVEIINSVINQLPSFYYLEFFSGKVQEGPNEPMASAQTSQKTQADSSHEHADIILNAYQGDEKEQAKILEEESRIREKAGENVGALRKEFYDAVQNKNAYTTIAALRLLALQDDIGSFLSEDEKLKKFLSMVWREEYGDEFADGFIQDPASPQCAKAFFRYVLEARLGLTEGHAARVGAKLSNIYKRLGKHEYSHLAYFDMEEKEFRWMEE